MKTKMITATTLALVAAANVQSSMAGDREWATAGKVLTGIAAASIISRAIEPRPTVVYAPVYTPAATTVVCQTVPTTTAVVTSQPVVTTTSVPVATVPDAPTIPNAPTVGTQTVVYQQAPTVVYQQPAVVYAPAPVVYAPAPVYCAPPRVGFSVVVGGGHYHGWHHRRW